MSTLESDISRPGGARPAVRAVLGLGIVAVLEFALCRAGLTLATVHGSVSPIWPAAGFAVAALVLGGRRLWPGVFAGALTATLSVGAPPPFAIGAAGANTVEAVVAATLLRDVRFRPALERTRDVLLFVLHACVAATALGAIVGTAAIGLTGMAGGADTFVLFRTWWVGDAMGVLLMAPPILVWARRRRRPNGAALEAALLTLLTVAASLAVFGTSSLSEHELLPLAFMLFPLFIWAALRHGPRGAVTQVLLLACIGVVGTEMGRGPLGATDVALRTELMWCLLGLGGLYVMVLAAVVSERQQAEDVLHRREAELRRSQKLEAIGTLTGGIAHDFNNILAAVAGYTELTLPDVAAGSLPHRNLQEVMRATERGRNLVDQALLFSGRNAEEARERLALHEVVDETVRLVRPTLPAGVSVRTHVAGHVHDVHGNRVQLDQVVLNLCTNAGHAMPKGGVIRITLDRVALEEPPAPDLPPGLYVRMLVADTGTGIHSAVLPRIFDPFFSTRANGDGPGHGLGLAVCHDIVAKHGGTITVASTVGEGTRFTVLLPAADSEHAPPLADTQRAARGRVLFVDDEATLVQLGRQMLQSLGYEVTAFTSALDAARAFRDNPDAFTAVVTDQVMPGMTGDEFATEMLRLRPTLPIVVCTGFGHAFTPERARAIGIREHLSKPFSVEELAGALHRAVAH